MALMDRGQQAELNEMLDEYVDLGMQASRDWANLWLDGLNYVFNNQLASAKRDKGWDRIQVNYIFPAVQQTAAQLAQRRPQIMALPFGDEDKEFAELNQGLLQYQFLKVLKMPRRLVAASLDAATCGHYVAKHFWEHRHHWDPRTHRWVGNPRVLLYNPWFFGADPGVEDIQDAGFVFGRRRMRVSKALKLWPEKKDEIQAAADIEESEGDPWAEQLPAHGADQSPKDRDILKTEEGQLSQLLQEARGMHPYQAKSKANEDGKDQATWLTLEEHYCRDEEEQQRVQEFDGSREDLEAMAAERGDRVLRGPEGKDYWASTGEELAESDYPKRTEQWQEPLYPFGRMILRIGGQEKTILNPRTEDQVYPYRRWPFTVGVNSVLPHVWQGLNDVEMSRGLQDWINLSACHMAQYVKQFADPVLMVEEGATKSKGEKGLAKAFAMRAGAIWQVLTGAVAGKKVQRLDPPNMSAGLVNFYQLMTEALKDQTGQQDVGLGKQTKGQPTATEIMQLQESGQVRTGLKSILMDETTVAIMEAIAELNQAHMELGEQRRIVGGKGRKIIEVVPELMDVDFDLKLEVGTALPHDRERMEQKYLALFQLIGPAILPELLDAMEIPNADEVLQRAQAWIALQQFMEQQEEAAQEAEQNAPSTPEEFLADEAIAAAGQEGALE